MEWAFKIKNDKVPIGKISVFKKTNKITQIKNRQLAENPSKNALDILIDFKHNMNNIQKKGKDVRVKGGSEIERGKEQKRNKRGQITVLPYLGKNGSQNLSLCLSLIILYYIRII